MILEKKVLDFGYVKLVESWGSDERVIEAARMSTQKGFEGWGPKEDGSAGDEKLLAFLYRNQHSTPFEMAGLIIEVQAPIFVFREWHRHRVQAFNEASARYAPLPALDYLPTLERMMENVKDGNKQAGTLKGSSELTEKLASNWLAELAIWQDRGEELYQHGLNLGVPKELARLAMSVGRFSRMRASANLRCWLGFLTLRQSPKAQKEIRLYAEVVHEILSGLFPRTLALFDEGTAR